MGSVYKRGAYWWVAFNAPGSGRVLRSTGLSSSLPEREARKVLEQLERELQNDVVRAKGAELTVAEYAIRWTEHRKAAKLTQAKRDLARLKVHAFPHFGAKRLAAVTTLEIRQFVTALRTAGWAARTVLNIYGLVRRLFADAVADELLLSTPCVLKRRDLPRKADKDPTWRANAVFSRDEVEQLITSGKVPHDRRMTYALAFLTGMREGEIAALRWSELDLEAEPLARLLVAFSFTRSNGFVKSTKTGQPREVPVHPTLHRLLADWQEVGFERYFGRAARPDDLVVPNRAGAHRTDNTFLKGLARDLQALGIRHRRVHDMRRTFVSLARADGANPAVLKSITHDQVGDQFDQYTTWSWASKCEAVEKLHIKARVLRATRARAASAATPTATIEGNDVETLRNSSGKTVGRAGLEPASNQFSDGQTRVFRSGGGSGRATGSPLKAVPCSNVANGAIVADLHEAMLAFARSGDRKALAARLQVLLAQVLR